MVCGIDGHYYQLPQENPFNGVVPMERECEKQTEAVFATTSWHSGIERRDSPPHAERVAIETITVYFSGLPILRGQGYNCGEM
jgi:hypothetical protein